MTDCLNDHIDLSFCSDCGWTNPKLSQVASGMVGPPLDSDPGLARILAAAYRAGYTEAKADVLP